MTANRSSARTGNASANSVSDWPCSERMSILRLVRLITGIFPGGFEWRGPLLAKGPLPETLALVLAGENPGNVLDRAADVVGEERDRTDHGERDHGKNNAVLRHRLAVLAVAERVGSDLHEGEELQHLCHLLSLIDAHAVAREFPEGKTGAERRLSC